MDMMLRFMLSQYAGLPFSQKNLHSWLEKWIYEQERRCADSAFAARFPWKETGLASILFFTAKALYQWSIFSDRPRYKAAILTALY